MNCCPTSRDLLEQVRRLRQRLASLAYQKQNSVPRPQTRLTPWRAGGTMAAMTHPAPRRNRRWLLLLAAPLLAALAFLACATLIPAPLPQALAALPSDAHVAVQSSPWPGRACAGG